MTVEFRLYYDEQGRVITYTCEPLEGDNYIIIDAETYAECRPDIRVIDGKITKQHQYTIISKLKPSTEGIACVSNDIAIVDMEYDDIIYWKLTQYEHKNY